MNPAEQAVLTYDQITQTLAFIEHEMLKRDLLLMLLSQAPRLLI